MLQQVAQIHTVLIGVNCYRHLLCDKFNRIYVSFLQESEARTSVIEVRFGLTYTRLIVAIVHYKGTNLYCGELRTWYCDERAQQYENFRA